jgi:hypothetical protein
MLGVVLDEPKSVFNILSKKFPDYENRQQIDMASEVFISLKDKKNLIVEARYGSWKGLCIPCPGYTALVKSLMRKSS